MKMDQIIKFSRLDKNLRLLKFTIRRKGFNIVISLAVDIIKNKEIPLIKLWNRNLNGKEAF